MLIVCPNCSTSYSVDQASLGAAGRTVRCARCKQTWFAGVDKAEPDLDAFVERTIAEAQIEANPPQEAAAQDTAPAANSISADGSIGEPQQDVPAEASTTEAETPADAASDQIHSGELIAMVPDAPSLVPPTESEPLPDTELAQTTSADPGNIESFAARRERLQARRKQTQSRSRWTAVILVLVGINVALIGARDDVVRYLPQTASFYGLIGLPVNLRHLAFEDVKLSHETTDGVPVLLIQGNIVSKSDHPIRVPRLRFAARSAKGQELYTWTALPSRSILLPGKSLPFQSRLASPPDQAVDIMVRFFNSKTDIAAAK